MENMLVAELQKNVGNVIAFWIQKLRFEGKVIEVDNTFLKYFDSFKNKERFVKISQIENMEIIK